MSEEIVTYDYLKNQILYLCDVLEAEKIKEPLDINECYFLDQSIRNDFEVLLNKLSEVSGSVGEPLYIGDVFTIEEMDKFNSALIHEPPPDKR